MTTLARVTQLICRSMSDMNCSMRRAVATAFSDCTPTSVAVVSRYMTQVSTDPFTASTNTTSPTNETTNLPNKPPRRNHPLGSALSIQFTVSAREGDRLDQNQPAVDSVGTEKLGQAE